MIGYIQIDVREDRWERLRKLLEVDHEHCDGMNECAICDEPLIDVAIREIETRRPCAALAADTERLNWLESREEAAVNLYNEQNPHWSVEVYTTTGGEVRDGVGKTLREAIDAARGLSKSGDSQSTASVLGPKAQESPGPVDTRKKEKEV